MKKLTLTFLVAGAAVALATISVNAPVGASPDAAQALAAAVCCDEPPPCYPFPCDPPQDPPSMKSARP